MKKIISLFLALFVLFGFSSCGAGSREEAHLPENTPVPETSSLAPSPSAAPTPEPTPLSAAYDADFTTDDGLIAVSIHDPAADPIPSAMPVLRAVPQEITSDMARQMAEAVFGDAPFYEYSEEETKAEIAELIKRAEASVLDEAILDDYGADIPQDILESIRDARLQSLEYYRNAYAYARDEVTTGPCQWKFWPLGHYYSSSFDYAGTDPSYTSSFPFGESVSLEATVTVNDIPYLFSAANYDRGDFRNHSLSIFIDTPDYMKPHGRTAEEIEAQWYDWNTSLGLYSTEPATEEQMEAVRVWAEKLAADMGLGEFQFTARTVDHSDISGGGWQIELEGLPVYQGFPLLRQGRPLDIGSGGMYDEAFTIVTNNDGTLIHLEYYTPLVVEEAEPVALMDAGQTKAAAESFLHSFSYSNLAEYFDKSYLDEIGAEITSSSLALDSVCVGYTRVEDGGSGFLLVPSVVFSGYSEILGIKANLPNEPWDPFGISGHVRPFLILDLRDGTRLY